MAHRGPDPDLIHGIGVGAPALLPGPAMPVAVPVRLASSAPGASTPASPAAPAAPASSGPGTCTEVVIHLPGVIVFHGTPEPLIGTVQTDLPAGEYMIDYDAEHDRLRIAPWPTTARVLDFKIVGPPRIEALYSAHTASLGRAPVRLRVIAAQGPAGGEPGGPDPCQGCTRVDALPPGAATALAMTLIGALGQVLPDDEGARWRERARAIAAYGESETHRAQPEAARVRALLAAHAHLESTLGGPMPGMPAPGVPGPGAPASGAPAPTTRQVFHDPVLQRSWAVLGRWEQALWRDYLARYGDTADVVNPTADPTRRDLHVTEDTRLAMALRMAPGYMAPGAREAAETLFNDPIFFGSTMLGLTLYFSAWVAPEPLISKAAAVLSTIALVGLAGFTASEIVIVAQAWMRLRHESARAVTLGELEGAAARFGHTLGGTGVRVLAVLVTLGVGKSLPRGPTPNAAPAVVPRPGGGGGMGGGGVAVAGVDMAELGWVIRVMTDGAVVLMAVLGRGQRRRAGHVGRRRQARGPGHTGSGPGQGAGRCSRQIVRQGSRQAGRKDRRTSDASRAWQVGTV